MKKLLALLVAGGLLALTTGCPPGTTSSAVPPPGPSASGTTPPPSGTTPPPANTNTPSPAKPMEAKGTVKSAAKDKVVITDAKGKDWDLDVTPDTKVTINGKKGTAEEIKKDSEVSATLKDGKAATIDATSAAPPPPLPPPPANEPKEAKGKVKSAAKDKVVITDAKGMDWDLAVTADTKVTIDDKKGEAENIKKGSEVTATTVGDKVTKIDATSPK